VVYLGPVRPHALTFLLLAAACAADGSDPEAATTSGTGDASADDATLDSTASATMTSSDPPTSADDGATSDGADDVADDDTSVDTGASTTGGGSSLDCEGSDLIVCEDFEAAALDAYPEGWDKRATGTWLGNTMGVANDLAHGGAQSLRIASGENGAQWLAYVGGLGDLATAHWGRMFVHVQVPAPWPADGVLHGDLFEARGPYGENNTNQVRWGIVENTQQRFQWIYNVQRSTDEFGTGTDYIYEWSDAWFCMEWHHDQTTQEATLWLDGVEISAISQVADMNPEIPVFDDISVGWANYQIASPEFVVHIDDVALHDERIGCE
jgi:hypothetical protein